MKYSTHDYAKALDEVIAGAKTNEATIIKNFLALVRRNGDEMRFGKLLDEAARIARSKAHGGAREVLVQSARPLGKAQEKVLHQFIKAGDVVKYAIDPDLVAGIKIIVNDEMQFDGSLKAKLDTLFAASI